MAEHQEGRTAMKTKVIVYRPIEAIDGTAVTHIKPVLSDLQGVCLSDWSSCYPEAHRALPSIHFINNADMV
jgi:hypothetical protein